VAQPGCLGDTMADDEKFEPRLGRIRSSGGGRGKSYLQRVLRAAALAGPAKAGTSKFQGSRIARGFGAGRVLAARDRLSAFRSRRVIIKTRIVKMGGKGAKAASLHLRYIQRDGVTQEGEPGELYGRDTDTADGKDFLERGEGDRHQFRFIVSAEDAGEYADLKPFVRKLMVRMEGDLDTELDWVAVDHHNTGHPHTHIVLRGRDDRGKDLVIARDYVAHGMRERAAEIVTLDLGPRSDLEIEDRFAKQVTQERLTDLDRALRRAADDNGELSLAQCKSGMAHHHWAGRLHTLSRMAMAEEIAPARWRLSPDLEATLKGMGERDDIIKIMNRELAARSMDRGLADLSVCDGNPITGCVLSRGLSDSRDDTHYLIVDGVDGRAHYAQVQADTDGAIIPGAIIRLGAMPKTEREVDRTVALIAGRHGGVYSGDLHRAHDPKASPEFIATHVRRLEAMRRIAGSVVRKADGSWTIPKDHAARGAAFDQDRTGVKVEVLSLVPTEALTTRRARTWLDQELLTETPTPMGESGFGHEARQAMRQRRAWLIQEGLAQGEGGRTSYRKDLLAHLKDQELAQAGEALAGTLGKRYSPISAGTVDGIYREPLQLVSGKFAVIEKTRDFTLVPWRPVLERQVGNSVQGVLRGDGVSWTVGRTRGPTIS
jgi:type IV secretory pathway VirD2 relaxase